MGKNAAPGTGVGEEDDGACKIITWCFYAPFLHGQFSPAAPSVLFLLLSGLQAHARLSVKTLLLRIPSEAVKLALGNHMASAQRWIRAYVWAYV